MVSYDIIADVHTDKLVGTMELSMGRFDYRDFAEWLVDKLHQEGRDSYSVMGGSSRSPMIKGYGGFMQLSYDNEVVEANIGALDDDVQRDVMDILRENADSGATAPDTLEGHIDSETGEPSFGDPDLEGQMGQVHKPFSHEAAGYVEEGDEEFSRRNKKCRDCAHYDDNGSCRIVPDISPEGYCNEFYADVGVFGVTEGAVTKANLYLIGHGFDWAKVSVKEFIRRAKDRLNEEAE